MSTAHRRWHSTATFSRGITGSLDQDFSLSLLRRVAGTLGAGQPTSPDGVPAPLKELRPAMAAMQAFNPRDEVEGLLAAQAVALNAASMECLRRAMIPNQPAEIQNQLLKNAANLARAFTDMLDAFDRKRGKHRQQVVRVERVTVTAGGQAIVGNIAAVADTTGGRDQAECSAEPHASPAGLASYAATGAVLPPLRGKDPGRKGVQVSRDAERPMPNARGRQHRAAGG